MSAASLCKRQFLPDNRPQGAILQAGEEPGVNLLFFGFRDAPESKGVNRGAARHQVPRRDRDVAAAAKTQQSACSAIVESQWAAVAEENR